MALAPRERNMLIFLAVVAVAAGAFFLLTSGGDDPEEAGPAPVPTAATPFTPAPTPSPAPTTKPPGRRRPPPLAVVTGRDPFVPLVIAETGGEATGTTPAEVGEEPVEPDGPVEPPDEGAERRELPGVTIGGRQVTLLDVFDRRGEQVGQVEVDGRTFVAAEGDRFAQNFRVVAIDGECATLLFGDETFRVCVPRQGK